MEETIEAIKKKVCTAKGREHKIYEDMALLCDSSFDYGCAMVIYIMQSELGEQVVSDAIDRWLKRKEKRTSKQSKK